MPNTKIGQPAPPPPSIRGISFDIHVVEVPYLSQIFLPRPSKTALYSSHFVIITPTLIARRSNSSRKLFRSRSKNGSLLLHSISTATRFL